MMMPPPQAMAAEAGVFLAARQTDQDSQVIQRIVVLVSTRLTKMEL